MGLPEIQLGSWFRWTERNNIKDSDKSGVYVLSKFAVAPHRSADLIQYITCHEIAHSIERKHNENFWNIVNKKFKDATNKEKIY